MLCIPAFLYSWNPVYAQFLEIELHQIQEVSEKHSHQWRQLENRLEYELAGEQVNTARINPSLAYDLEFLDDGQFSEYEHSLYLQKEFRTPGHYRSLRDLSGSRVNQYENQVEIDKAQWLGEMRLDFIRIVLMEHELEMMDKLKNQVSRMTDASMRRVDTGEESALDHQLLQMSNYQLQIRLEELFLEKNRLETSWRGRMGIDDDTDIVFKGQFDEPDVTLPDTGTILQFLEESPRFRADHLAVETAGLGVIHQQNSRISTFGLSAGYKHLNPNWSGFLVGVEIPIPILSSNSEAIAQARTLERIQQTNLEATRFTRGKKALQLADAFETQEELLDRFPEHLNNPDRFLRTLSISYEEGTRSLSDILTILNLTADTYQTRFRQLETFYSIITELEVLVDQSFLHH